MEGKRLTSRKNLIFFPTWKGVRKGRGGGLLTAKLSAESVFVSIFFTAEMHLLTRSSRWFSNFDRSSSCVCLNIKQNVRWDGLTCFHLRRLPKRRHVHSLAGHAWSFRAWLWRRILRRDVRARVLWSHCPGSWNFPRLCPGNQFFWTPSSRWRLLQAKTKKSKKRREKLLLRLVRFFSRLQARDGRELRRQETLPKNWSFRHTILFHLVLPLSQHGTGSFQAGFQLIFQFWFFSFCVFKSLSNIEQIRAR